MLSFNIDPDEKKDEDPDNDGMNPVY